jgi:hypothetical protein
MTSIDQIDDEAHQQNEANHFSPDDKPCKVQTVDAEKKEQNKCEDQ